MANDNENFVEKRLGALNEPEGFQPNAGRARALLRGQPAPRSRRWLWAAIPVAAVALIAVLLPASSASATTRPAHLSFVDHFSFENFHFMVRHHWLALAKMIHGPDRAHDFALADASGKVVRLSDYRGKVVLLNFWATWCEPCKHEVPWFVDLQKTYKDDLVVLGVSFDEDGWNTVRPFIEERNVNYPVVLATPELPEEYRKIESLPATLIINRDGRVVDTHLGLGSKARYEELIKGQL